MCPTSRKGGNCDEDDCTAFRRRRGGRRLRVGPAQPAPLEAFLRRMPKGGDLHNHLSGAIYAESLIGWAVADGLCVERVTVTLRPPPCAPAKGVPALADTLPDPEFYATLIRAFSMRDFVPGRESGH